MQDKAFKDKLCDDLALLLAHELYAQKIDSDFRHMEEAAANPDDLRFLLDIYTKAHDCYTAYPDCEFQF